MKRWLRIVAGTLLIPLLAVAALDLLSVFGFVFTMTNADVANPEISQWLNGGAYCFFPALMLGLVLVTVPRLSKFVFLRKFADLLVLFPITWLLYGAFSFAQIELSETSFRAKGSQHLQNVIQFSVAEVLAAICLWIVRVQPTCDGTSQGTDS